MVGVQEGGDPHPEHDELKFNPDLISPIASDIRIEKVTKGRWSAKLINPPNSDANRVILYLHGFDLISRSYYNKWGMAAEIARMSGSSLLQLDYHFGLEHSYDAAVEDCCAAFDWLWSEWYEPEKICLVGESFGAGLALITLDVIKKTRNRSAGPTVLISPLLDAIICAKANGRTIGHDPVIESDLLERICVFYKGSRGANATHSSAIRADLRGLPPILIQVGDREVLRDDAQLLFQQAKRAWVDVELEVWPEMIHGWHHYYYSVDQSRRAINRIGEFLISKTDF
jgi:monoterpene epsilon-lactone hydrolase